MFEFILWVMIFLFVPRNYELIFLTVTKGGM